MNYIELNVKNQSNSELNDVLIAELGEIGFESFAESEEGFLAYIREDLFDADLIGKLQIIELNPDCFSYTYQLVEDQNWNAVWESNYEAVVIANRCGIRAPFHPENKDVEYDLVIEPKMSFGTAHHETTSNMIEFLLEEDLKNKTVLDMGCGTSVLAILAAKRGGINIYAIDNDEWAYENSLENTERNQVPEIKVLLGDAALLHDMSFDVIIANINRNILLNDIKHYVNVLNDNGVLLMSGFYEQDIPAIKEETEKYNLHFDRYKLKNNWVAIRFTK